MAQPIYPTHPDPSATKRLRVTLSSFLDERLAEDEVAISAVLEFKGTDYGHDEPANIDFDERFSPQRMARQCESARAIVDMALTLDLLMAHGAITPVYGDGFRAATETAMRHLAAAYSDHEDYDERWSL